MDEFTPPSLEASGVVPPEAAKSMSGLAMMRAIIEGRLPPPPMAATLEFAVELAEEGRVVFVGRPSFRHYNPFGVAHGGYAGALLDSCMTCAVQSTLEPGFGTTTLEYKVSMVRPMTEKTGIVRAEGKTLYVGKRSGTAEGRIIDAAGRLLAHGTTTCLIFSV